MQLNETPKLDTYLERYSLSEILKWITDRLRGNLSNNKSEWEKQQNGQI